MLSHPCNFSRNGAETPEKKDIMATESTEEHGKNKYITRNLSVFFRDFRGY